MDRSRYSLKAALRSLAKSARICLMRALKTASVSQRSWEPLLAMITLWPKVTALLGCSAGACKRALARVTAAIL